jgi:hypothetical protein
LIHPLAIQGLPGTETPMFPYLLAAILLISLSGFYLGRKQASNLRSQTKLHSLPQYHGYFIALWCGIPTTLTHSALDSTGTSFVGQPDQKSLGITI